MHPERAAEPHKHCLWNHLLTHTCPAPLHAQHAHASLCYARYTTPHPLQAYQGALQSLGAIADRLRASSGRFFFGDKPSSLDALLFGHLAFYKHSPVAAPALRDKVGCVCVLCGRCVVFVG